MNKNIVFYVQPQVEVVDVDVEMGFALSPGGDNTDPGWGDIM